MNKLKMIILLIVTLMLQGCTTVEVDKHMLSEDNVEPSKDVIINLVQNNHVVLNLKDEGFNDLSVMDKDTGDNKIFFTGETHGVKENTELRMKFLKYYKEKTNFKYYLCELPYSVSFYINEYLTTGNESILKEVYKPLRGTYASTQENYNHWKELYEFNKSLKEEDKIVVVGVDVEHQFENAYHFLTQMLNDKEIPEDKNVLIDDLYKCYEKKYTINDIRSVIAVSTRLKKDMQNDRNAYEKMLGDDLVYFELVNENVLNAVKFWEAKDVKSKNNIRDKIIYNNFVTLDNTFDDSKYYGQWGWLHVFKAEDDGVKWFATYLNEENEKYAGKVVSTLYCYEDCYQINLNDPKSNNQIDFAFFYAKQCDFDNAKDPILFDIESGNDIMENVEMHSVFNGVGLKRSIIDYIDYMVLIRHSDSCTSIKEEQLK